MNISKLCRVESLKGVKNYVIIGETLNALMHLIAWIHVFIFLQ